MGRVRGRPSNCGRHQLPHTDSASGILWAVFDIRGSFKPGGWGKSLQANSSEWQPLFVNKKDISIPGVDIGAHPNAE